MRLSGSFSVGVIRRILVELRNNHSGVNRTRLAVNTGLNYNAVIRYIQFLRLLRWMSGSTDQGALLYLTSTGEEFLNVLSVERSTDALADERDLSASKLIQRSLGDIHPSDGYLPDLPAPVTSKSNSGNAVSQKEFRIIIVDDEPDALLSYKVNLESCGFFTFAASDASAALKEFQKDVYRYDLVLSDIRMKRMNGLELFVKLKQLRPDVSIILTSALDAGPELASVLPGFDSKDFLEKPIDRDTLVRKVSQVAMQRKPAHEESIERT